MALEAARAATPGGIHKAQFCQGRPVIRPTWDETWMAVAEAVAARSRCVRSSVGVAVVDADNRIRATGYNGPPAGLNVALVPGDCLAFCPRSQRLAGHHPAPLPGDNRFPLGTCGEPGCARPVGHAAGEPTAGHDDCVASHAEANALMFGDRTERLGGTLYSTRVPCQTCAKMVANSGLARVVCRVTEADAHLDPTRSIRLLRDCGLEVYTDV
jgi:dCMP deaminase